MMTEMVSVPGLDRQEVKRIVAAALDLGILKKISGETRDRKLQLDESAIRRVAELSDSNGQQPAINVNSLLAAFLTA